MAMKRKGVKTDTERAVELIRFHLSHGPALAYEVKTAIGAEGIGRNPIDLAAKRLGVIARKVGKYWEWSLPDDGKTAPTEVTMVDGMPVAIDATMPGGELRDSTPYELPPGRIGVIPDVHAPFHHAKWDGSKLSGAYPTALHEMRDAGCDTYLINGDFMDFYSLSFHERDGTKRNLAWEIEVGRQLLAHLRAFVGPDARIIYREGNHEERWWRYMFSKAEDFKDVDDFQFQNVMRLQDHGIEWIGDRARVKAGHLNLEHGHEFYGSGGAVPARNYLLKSMDNVLVSHVHRTSEFYYRKPHDGDMVAGFSTGCLCDLNPKYFPRNNWTHGFAIVDVQESGEFEVTNKIILRR